MLSSPSRPFSARTVKRAATGISSATAKKRPMSLSYSGPQAWSGAPTTACRSMSYPCSRVSMILPGHPPPWKPCSRMKPISTHLAQRGMIQTVMLGFSDGTKDGGYLQANWSIFKAKETISRVADQYGVKVVFFDGRGGPPSRGGGNTHNFYAALGDRIHNHRIQLTIQGQTISSRYGQPDSCRFNLEQLLTAGLENALFSPPGPEPERRAAVPPGRTVRLGLPQVQGPERAPAVSRLPGQDHADEILRPDQHRFQANPQKWRRIFSLGSAGHPVRRVLGADEAECSWILWSGHGHQDAL